MNLREWVEEPNYAVRADLHIHPLAHKYYGNCDDLRDIILDEKDKKKIRKVIDWCIKVRGLGAIALTDHDMIQSSLYAAEHVKKQKLDIEIITGAECEVTDPEARISSMPIHLLCLGIKELPAYTRRTAVDKMIRLVHEMGGKAIMAHPIYYPETFCRYAYLLDGYEYENGGAGMAFTFGMSFLKTRVFDHKIKYYCNSDFHYELFLPRQPDELLCNEGWEGL
ncbi:MAG: PHP domain-containing protein [Oscillospiraceae bacterium]|nr:PHP domain-containing protein [Oscillospiraceae bacterium]